MDHTYVTTEILYNVEDAEVSTFHLRSDGTKCTL